MITPKEKAKALVDRFIDEVPTHNYNFQDYQAKVCALVLVTEILSYDFLEPQIKRHVGSVPPTPNQLEYWFEVKKEIQNFGL
jgi:hypothetical protein